MTTHEKEIVLLPGDGIGPEIMRAAVSVLKVAPRNSATASSLLNSLLAVAPSMQRDEPLPAKRLRLANPLTRSCSARSEGPSGMPSLSPSARKLACWRCANRSACTSTCVPSICALPLYGLSPLRADRVSDVHIDFVRELAGDIYFGKHDVESDPSGERATDEAVYTTAEVERVAKYAFARAEARTRRLASVDKANVLSTSQLWRRTVTRMSANHPNVKLEHLYVDNAAMQLVLAPAQFDVILTSNMFGDILTDLGAALAGSIGLIPSMSSGPGPSCV